MPDALDTALRALRAEQARGVREWKPPAEGDVPDDPHITARRRAAAYRASLEFDRAHPAWSRHDPIPAAS